MFHYIIGKSILISIRIMNAYNVGMIHFSEDTCFTLKTLDNDITQFGRQYHFQSNNVAKHFMLCFKNDTHTSSADNFCYFVLVKFLTKEDVEIFISNRLITFR